ncbi:MAG: hypothetical protein Q8N16_02515 [bacterium]|nr:hypothetical protein [bacterium]
MRRLPRKPSQRQDRIIQAVEEWFGKMNPAEKKASVRISLFLMGRRKGIELAEEEKDMTWYVSQNLASESHQMS